MEAAPTRPDFQYNNSRRMPETTPIVDLLREELSPLSGLALHVACNSVRRLLESLDPPSYEPVWRESLPPLTPAEFKQFGEQTISYGKYAGNLYKDIPREYLEWLGDAKRAEWRELRRYLRHNETAAHAED